MSPGARMECLESVHKRYKRASRKEKSLILDEFCATCDYHRKHAIRLLSAFKRFTKPKPKKRGRPSMYNKPSIIEPLKRIWLAANLPCSKRLKAIIPLWLPAYEREYKALSVSDLKALKAMSPATIDRVLDIYKERYRGRGRSTTKPSTLLKSHIPVKTNQWDEKKPGFLEADTVAHCGDSALGDYVYTIDTVDIATGWTEQRAVWGKGETGVVAQVQDIEASLPFPLLGFDSDNGHEFLNWHLWRNFTDRKRPVQFTRSRAYHKDDNAHVEQKNWTHVRQWLGYHRFDDERLVEPINDLYKNEWRLYHNFFMPSVKLIEKKMVAAKTIKRYDSPKTPYQRVVESPDVELAAKKSLKEQYEKLNPFQLRRDIETKIKKIFETLKYRRVRYASVGDRLL